MKPVAYVKRGIDQDQLVWEKPTSGEFRTLVEVPTHVTPEMVDRFLQWPLPETVCADRCTTEARYYQKRGYDIDHRCGTNLLSADEARQMLEHVLGLEKK